MKALHPHDTVLALVPATRGVGFAAVEARGRLIGWGFAQLYSPHNEELLRCVEQLTDKYRAKVICVEDADGFRRRARARTRITAAISYASMRKIPVVVYSPSAIRATFDLPDDATKLDLANAVASIFAELMEFIPNPRRIWEPENERIWMFRAVALALAGIRRPI